MNSLIFVNQSSLRRATKNAGQFTSTVLLTDDTKSGVLNGTIKLRKGQWVIDGATGSRGQFVAVKKTNLGLTKNIAMRAARPGMKFGDYQKRLAA